MAASPNLPRSATDTMPDTSAVADASDRTRFVPSRHSPRRAPLALARTMRLGVYVVGGAAVISVLVLIGEAAAAPHAAAAVHPTPTSPSTNGPVGTLAVIMAVAIVVVSAVVALRLVFHRCDETGDTDGAEDGPRRDLDDLDDGAAPLD